MGERYIGLKLKPGDRLIVEVEKPADQLVLKDQDPHQQAFQDLSDWLVEHAGSTLFLAQEGIEAELDLVPDERLGKIVADLRTHNVMPDEVEEVVSGMLTEAPSLSFEPYSQTAKSVASRITKFLRSIETWEKEES